MNRTIIAGSNSSFEAERLSQALGYPLIHSIKRLFPDGEMHVHLDNEVKTDEVIIYQTMSPSPNDSIIETLLIADLLKGKKLTLIAPWLAYSRQDKQWFKTECVSLKTIASLLACTGVKKVIAFDLHFHRLPGTFKQYGIEWVNLTAAKALINQARTELGNDFKIIGPDEGSRDILEYVGGEVVFSKHKVCKKCSKPAQECACTTSPKEYEIINELTQEIREKNVLILDDIISSGGTILKAIEKLKGKKIAVAITHAFFSSENLKRIKDKTELVLTTNTVRNEARIIDIVPLITEYFNA